MLLVQAMYSSTNLGNPDFCAQVFGKNRRQHSVILLINDGVETFSVLRFGQILQLNVCHGARCNNLDEQNLSSLK